MPVWFLFALTFAGEPLPAVGAVDSPNLRTDVVEFADQALSASRNLFEVVMRPLRDSPQLLPWNDAPIEPAPEAAKAKALGGNLFVLGDTPEAKAFWKWRVEGGGNFRQGNTSTNNVNAVFNAERRSAVSAFLGRFGATYNQVDGNGQDNRRFFGDATYDRHWRGRWICYSRQELENDQARRIDVRSISSTGLGY